MYRLKHAYRDADGKRHVTTITAPTEKMARAKAKALDIERLTNTRPSMTVSDALNGYLRIKSQVLSPSTSRSYLSYMKNHFDKIGNISLREITKPDVQMWVSDLSTRLSPKMVKNVHGLLHSALTMYDESLNFRITLPQAREIETYCPTDADVLKLIATIKERGDKPLLIATYLAAFGPMRAGEICAVESFDVHGDCITVNKAMAYTPDNNWIVKPPKTKASNRTIQYQPFVIDEIKGIKGRLVPLTPTALYDRFRVALKASGLPHFRFHDLRAYSISIQHAIGVADLYIIHRSGHATDYVMKKHYRKLISTEEQKQQAVVVNYFENLAESCSL